MSDQPQADPDCIPVNVMVMPQVFLLQIDSMQGYDNFHDTAYEFRATAEMVAEELSTDWVGYVPLQSEAEVIPDSRCVVGARVFKLDSTTPEESHRQRAIEKLTDEEKSALGLQA